MEFFKEFLFVKGKMLKNIFSVNMPELIQRRKNLHFSFLKTGDGVSKSLKKMFLTSKDPWGGGGGQIVPMLLKNAIFTTSWAFFMVCRD